MLAIASCRHHLRVQMGILCRVTSLYIGENRVTRKSNVNSMQNVNIHRYISSFPSSEYKPPFLLNPMHHLEKASLLPWNNLSLRYKSSKRKKNKHVEESSDDDEEEDEVMTDEEELKGKDYRDMKLNVSSLRLDAVLHTGLSMSRRKVEEAFYGSKIRINGKKVLKKSTNVDEGDEVDLIKGVSKNSDQMLEISRIVIGPYKYNPENDKYTVKMRRFKSLNIYNYDDKWSGSVD